MIYFQNPSPVPFRSELDSEGEKKVIAVLTRVSRKCETTNIYIYIYIPVFSFVSWVSSTPEYSKNNVATSRQGPSICQRVYGYAPFPPGLLPAREKFMEKNIEPATDWHETTPLSPSSSGFTLVT